MEEKTKQATSLDMAICAITAIIAKYGKLSELQTWRMLISLLIHDVLGFTYGMGDVGEYEEEVEVKSGTTTTFADAVLHGANGKAVIEAKALNEPLDGHIEQALSYGTLLNAVIVILTNGIEYRIFVTDYNGKFSPSVYKTFRLDSMTDAQKTEFLSLFKGNSFDINLWRKRQKAEQESLAEEKRKAFYREKAMQFFSGTLDEATILYLKSWVKEYENTTQVVNMNTAERVPCIVSVLTDLRSEIERQAVEKDHKDYNLSNHTELEEAHLGGFLRATAMAHGVKGVHLVDSTTSECSKICTANGKNLMFIIGETNAETGWKFKGISFPNRIKQKGKDFIPCENVEDVEKHLDTFLWYLDNIEKDSYADEWQKRFGATA